jgi:hypothetical protein
MKLNETSTGKFLLENDQTAFALLTRLGANVGKRMEIFLLECIQTGQLSMMQSVRTVGGITAVCRENFKWSSFMTSLRTIIYFDLIKFLGHEALLGFTDTRVLYYLAQWVNAKMDRAFGANRANHPALVKKQHDFALEGIELFKDLDRDAAKILRDQANMENPTQRFPASANGEPSFIPSGFATTSPAVQPETNSPTAITNPEVIMAYEIGFDRYQQITHQSRTQAMESISAIFRESDSLTLQALTEWSREGVQTGLAGLVKIGLDLLEQERELA